MATSGGTANATINSDYTLTFTITGALPVTQWEIVLGTRITGSLTAVDDNAGLGNGGNATLTAVTGRLNGVVDAQLGLASAGSSGSTSSTSGVQTSINVTNSKTVTGTGNGSFTLRFTWTSTATSPQALNGGDEHAVRLGADGPLGGATADDYPGVGNRNQANDGHFVNATLNVLVVPEPATIALLGVGAVGVVIAARRRSRA